MSYVAQELVERFAVKLRVTEIFYSLQGETRTVGIPTTFVRLTGCPLRCQYCDTQYAFHGGKILSLFDIFQKVKQYRAQNVTITGGEPLAQPSCLTLLEFLCDMSYDVSLETSGALDLGGVDSRVIKIVDFKTPGSKEIARNRYENICYLSSRDHVKFVICDRQDYEWSKSLMEEYRLSDLCEVLFSPSFGQLDNAVLADWILEDHLPVRFQLQMHKYIWGDIPGK